MVEQFYTEIRIAEKHEVPTDVSPEMASDMAFLIDFDLAILGAPAEEYDRYEENVRKEYDWVTDEAWKAGRADFLNKFLQKDRIFKTEEFFRRYEQNARNNMERSLEQLEAGL